MSELEYVERMIEITQIRLDKANDDLNYYTAELNMFLSIKRRLREAEQPKQEG